MSLSGVVLSETKVEAMKRAAESTSQSAPGDESRYETGLRRTLGRGRGISGSPSRLLKPFLFD